MFEYQTVYNAYTAMVAGLITSVHCVGMCGPLSCAFAPARQSDASVPVVLTSYHLSKLLAYAIVGGLAGGVGSQALSLLEESWLRFVPWILVLFFVLVAFRLDRYFPKPKWLGGLYRRLSLRFQAMSKPVAAACIGLCTPLIPCGPLYMIFGLALFSGSALKGIEFAVGFGLGTLPLLWFAQTQFMRVHRSAGYKWLPIFQRVFALIAALVIAWRLRTTLGIEGAENWVCHPF